jgi:FtsP/CotA-like multicopper oxidase with cupredoxin domain
LGTCRHWLVVARHHHSDLEGFQLSFYFKNSISRRRFLAASASLGLAGSLNPFPSRAAAAREFRLRAATGKAQLSATDPHQTAVWAYNGQLPSPVLRAKQGELFRAVIENGLEQNTTVHWHGIRVPNAMDGVPGLTQQPIKPGDSFTYELTPPDAGTFWYHPHANSLEQIGRGLAGLLIVEERETLAVDRDLAWLLQDWRLTEQHEISSHFGGMMDAAMAGRVGNVTTINGAPPADLVVRKGERIRLRLANAALARMMALRFEGHQPLVIAIDGQPCDPHEPENGRLMLGPAMRIDIVLDMQGESGKHYAVTDDFYDGLSYTLTNVVYVQAPALRDLESASPLSLRRNPLPEPDITNAIKLDIVLQGGMMGGGKLSGVGGMKGSAMPGMNGGPVWAINGTSMTGDGMAGMEPLFTLARGQSCHLTIRNETAWWHTMHIHGFTMFLLTRNGQVISHKQWQDTVLMAPKDIVECAFVADNPGNWMLHCHVTDHQMAGLMTVFRVT